MPCQAARRVLDEPGHGFDLSSLLAVVSSRPVLGPVKDEFFRTSQLFITDASFLGEREQRMTVISAARAP